MTTLLPTTRLGRTGMHLTRVGFGAWAVGGGLELKDDDLTDIAAAIRATGAGTGPASPSPA